MNGALPKVLDHLRHDDGGVSDGHLLAAFLAAGDEAAFAALVRRHGPMVLGVCRRVLRDVHDAEDAFQATFLVLAAQGRRGEAPRSARLLAVRSAYNTALAAAERSLAAVPAEKPMNDLPNPGSAPAADEPDWRPLLDRELARLSEKYRSAIVLCDWQGRGRRPTRRRRVGCAAGHRLQPADARARALLAKRLAGGGLTTSGAALAARWWRRKRRRGCRRRWRDRRRGSRHWSRPVNWRRPAGRPWSS